MNIQVTVAAKKYMIEQIDARGSGVGIRVGVKKSGCSGMAYVMEFVDELSQDDTCIGIENSKLVIDEKSLVYLEGITIDYAVEGVNSGIKFINPNAKAECGCGESFTV